MSDLEAFRSETRAWLEENCPATMRSGVGESLTSGEGDICWGGRKFQFKSEDQKLWLERMGSRGWTVPTWPTEYGGGGLSKDEAKILQEELRRIKAKPALVSFGIWMLGPALLKFGTHEQKLEHLPKIARGEIRWCQGYSEPNAGSDLASLATKAEDKGDHYIVNGQKVWTSYADQADWIFCLVRTNPDDKHNGISFVLFDMESEGVSTKPIQLISGYSPFCETFFDNVTVSKTNLVGEENKGWTIAKYLLTHERTGISDMGMPAPLNSLAVEKLGTIDGELEDKMLRHQIAEHEIDAASFVFTMERAKDEAKAGGDMGAFSSMLKGYGTEINKARHELIVKVNGSDAFEWEGQFSNNGEIARSWLRTKANSIEGGTTEVQLNIIAKRILDLPA
ncbi:acyl-CoA dehydrogenase family protein [Kordiimonas sp. SCSIO 12603]|uniref:acyl-CoA dehydrogenase family protein n=1 Tax=Kordiimonas sp. SCSIO 12603 TaxID=2829596 RepID=UPI002105D538|nr:acyl-CoA dehydrogenase family protein [Kordiimonas sp. SCSIO 12603]UTW57205.1 acyl-CoA dehydrogenase family protein [Kordiimonas sp. SCSIO 12603]